ncbi:glutamine--fructose-6-phosphate transaminase (isomerizing) [Candidatus Woesearchaeota archaeon]|nr:glutamine--fructose-6-phosphate transaminase (isomerizing) [Candidatus Woesearchaeota archaeon]
MCGIAGYYGKRGAYPILFKSLKLLEYRGYDSWGIATKQNNQVFLEKNTGKLPEKTNQRPGSIGIAHTRWATNGKVTQQNAHPHSSNDGEVFIVHNRIIENYSELKKELESQGIKFKTETDTEVIPNLLSLFLKNYDLKTAIEKTISLLKGNYSFVGLLKNEDKLFFAKDGSPLVIGLGNSEIFFASDVPAFIEYTRKVLFLNDKEYGIYDRNLKVYQEQKEVQKQMEEITWNVEQAQKGNYPHFMIKEINEQKNTMNSAITQDEPLIKRITEEIKNAFGVFFVGCGTSYHACVSASYNFSHIAKKHVNVVLASEFRNYSEFLTPHTLMIAVSQSGETADLIDAIKIAKSKGVKIISIVNVIGSTINRLSDESIIMNAGPEICVLSTKSYTSQLAILLLLAYSVAGKLEEGKKLIQQTTSQVHSLITDLTPKIKSLAKKLKDESSIFIIGRDLAFPSTLEGALKIKEVSYIHAEGFAGGELKHGTMALIEEGTPVIVLSTEQTRNAILNNASEVKARGAYVIGIDSKNSEIYDKFISVPELNQANPITMIIPIQLLAYNLALERNCDPDKPRNLAKAVTVR